MSQSFSASSATAGQQFLQQILANRRRLIADSSRQGDTAAFPNADQLAETVAFAPREGHIWLCGQRYLLMQGAAFGQLRRELIQSLGLEKARGLLTRIGWQAGARQAERVAEQWPEGEHGSLYSAGPHLHMLEGMVNVEQIRFEIDNSIGHFYAEHYWYNSLEDDEHIAASGIGDDSACWMQIGFASGYASSLLGRLVVFREVECRATGHQACRIIGKPAEQWDDIEPDLAYLDPEAFLSRSTYSHPQEPSQVPTIEEEPAMVGASQTFNAACRKLQRVAPTQATVLLSGESGVGKELFAQRLHQTSPRSRSPFVALNCATLPEHLVEAELFGVERGAFTGAHRSRPGRFERAHGGTLFLDEIVTLTPSAQSKILRALQEGEVERIGGDKPIRVDVRVVAASNVDLQEEVRAGRFREDLYYRLNIFPIHLPPLRERREDILLLAQHFLRRFCGRYGRNVNGFAPSLRKALLAYAFPGNVRELQNLVERGVIACDDGEAMDLQHIDFGDLSLELEPSTGRPLEQPVSEQRAATTESQPALSRLADFINGRERRLGTTLKEIKDLLVRIAMERSTGNITAAAQMLGMSRAQVSYRLKGK
jgi:DNA-binding NtrC family response regulator/predicted hydrocarbon binding protein